MTEEMAKPGRSRIIKNLAPSLTERGKIKIGKKGEMITSRKGNEFQPPVKLEYFRVVSLHRGDDGNYISDMAIHDMFGDKPTELPVRLLFDDIELNFQCRYSCFKGKQQWCSGDGEYGWRIDDKTGETKAFKCPCHRQDPAYTGTKDKCKINSCLSVLIDGVETIGGVWKFRTISYHSTVGLLSSLTLIKSVTGGPLAGIPLTLYVLPKTVVSPADGRVQTVYIVGLEYKGSFEQLQELGYTHALDRQKHMIRMDDIEENARKLLQAGEDIVDEDVVPEFYPEQMIDSEKKASDLTEKIKEKPKYKATEIETKDPAETLKDKLDAGDRQAEGYSPEKWDNETKGTWPITGEDLEQDEPESILPDGVDAIAWLITSHGRSSPENADRVMRVFKAEEKKIESQSDEIKAKLRRKYKDVRDYLAQIEANKKEIATKEPPPPDDENLPAFEQQNNQEFDEANGRLKFLASMNKYLQKDHLEFSKVLEDNSTEEHPLTGMNDVPKTKVDQDYILGRMAEAFKEE